MKVEVPNTFRLIAAQFSPQEIDSLTRIMNTPEFQKLEAVVESMRPSANCTGAGSSARDAFSSERANARLGEIRGWEIHRAAYWAALKPKAEPKHLTENYQPVQEV